MNKEDEILHPYIIEAAEMLREMKEESAKRYMIVYIQSGLKSDEFFYKFGEYLSNCKGSKTGYRRISANGFKNFLLDSSFNYEEEVKNICGVNYTMSKVEKMIVNEMNAQAKALGKEPDGDEYILRSFLWNNGIIDEMTDKIPSEEEIIIRLNQQHE